MGDYINYANENRIYTSSYVPVLILKQSNCRSASIHRIAIVYLNSCIHPDPSP